MSRSYHHIPMVKQKPEGHTWKIKKLYNHRIRKFNKNFYLIEEKPVPDGNTYRKYSQQWDICDYKWYVTDINEVKLIRRK